MRCAPPAAGDQRARGLADLACAYAVLESAQAGRRVEVGEVAAGSLDAYQRPINERFRDCVNHATSNFFGRGNDGKTLSHRRSGTDARPRVGQSGEPGRGEERQLAAVADPHQPLLDRVTQTVRLRDLPGLPGNGRPRVARRRCTCSPTTPKGAEVGVWAAQQRPPCDGREADGRHARGRRTDDRCARRRPACG